MSLQVDVVRHDDTQCVAAIPFEGRYLPAPWTAIRDPRTGDWLHACSLECRLRVTAWSQL